MPDRDRTTLNAISKTAFLCCGGRAEDARSPAPVCADIYAEDFMTDEGRSVLKRFAANRHQNISNVVRARIVQDEISKHIKRNKDVQVVNIGAGFDSLPYRIAGGRWFEFDEPAIIEHKNERVPTDRCPNFLQRTAVDFAAGELPGALRRCDPNAESVVVIEGVLMYLERAQLLSLLDALSANFPNHTLICDLMDKAFFTKYVRKMHEEIVALGSEFKFVDATPERVFLDYGYTRQREPQSIVAKARDFKVIYMPGILFRTVHSSARDGYRVHTFTFNRPNY